MTEKRYNIIYADPCWAYNESGSGNRVVHSKYNTMQIEELEELPIKEVCKDNCILFMWVTFPRLQEGLRLINSWGFKYKGHAFTWIKKNKKSNSNFWGMGYYTRQNPEICLIGVKGKIKPLVHNIHSVIESPIREHSRKPDIVRKHIVDICGDLPRIELFARQKTEGWDVWGDEITKFKDEDKAQKSISAFNEISNKGEKQ